MHGSIVRADHGEYYYEKVIVDNVVKEKTIKLYVR